MLRKKIISLGLLGFLVFLNLNSALAQEEKVSASPPLNLAEVQWLWGEVSSVDNAQKSLVVKYIDYDTDLEKEATINVDEQTTFENIKGLSEVKPQDTVSVDYIVTAEGKDLAKNISVEKIEEDITESGAEDLMVVPEKVGSGPPSEMSEPDTSAAEPAPQPEKSEEGANP